MRYRFNQFTLDTDQFELRDENGLLPVEPQVLELLSVLIENRERMVSKEEINQKVWQGRPVSDAALSSRIKMARQILGDDGRKQSVIRTIHKKGFRFVAELENENVALARSCADTEGEAAGVSFIEDRPVTTPANNNGANKPSVAVLPFENLSSEPEQEYFSDGITSDIISMLSKHRWLNVTARNTSFGYKGKVIDVRQLNNELGVGYVVEGAVRRAGNRIRVTAALVDAGSGHQIWADRYDRELEDIFDLQDEVTEMIVARLEPEIGVAERSRVVLSRPDNLQAWDTFHLGIYHFFKFTGPDNLEAQRLLLQSQQMDPGFGEAFAWWAYAVIIGMVYWETKPSQALLDDALEACNTALLLDRQNATFYALKARVLLARREYDQAIVENQTAIRLNPSFAAAYCGLGDSLTYEGRYEESVSCFDRAIELSPNDPQLWAFLSYGALSLIFQGDYPGAIEWAERASSIPNCQYWATAHKLVASAYLDQREMNAIEQTRARLLAQCPEFTRSFAQEKLFYLREQSQIDLYLEGLEKAGIPLK